MSNICIAAVTLAALGMTAILVAASRRLRRYTRNPMRQVFRRKEWRDLDAQLEIAACQERRRLDDHLAAYLAGDTGHVVAVSTAHNGVHVELSDQRRLALCGASRRLIEPLNRYAQENRLRPRRCSREAFSYELVFRGADGAETTVYARTVVLTG